MDHIIDKITCTWDRGVHFEGTKRVVNQSQMICNGSSHCSHLSVWYEALHACILH